MMHLVGSQVDSVPLWWNTLPFVNDFLIKLRIRIEKLGIDRSVSHFVSVVERYHLIALMSTYSNQL